MAILVIGGNTRNIGKTSLVAGIIAALPELHWTAFKITQYGHNVCSANGEPCDCQTADHALAVTEERDPATGTDSSRYLAAGAARSLWVRTRQGELADAMPRIRKELAASENAILESNSVLRFLRPDLFVSVLDPANPDFKPSARRYLDRADAVVVSGAAALHDPAWPDISPTLLRHARIFPAIPGTYCPPDLITFVRTRLAALNSQPQTPNSEPQLQPPPASDSGSSSAY